jgi:hypothetical protein
MKNTHDQAVSLKNEGDYSQSKTIGRFDKSDCGPLVMQLHLTGSSIASGGNHAVD